MESLKQLVDMLKECEKVTDIVIEREMEKHYGNGWTLTDPGDHVKLSFRFYSPIEELNRS